MKKILLVEDTRAMAKTIGALLHQHQVTWVVGVQSLEPFVGVGPDGKDVSIAPAEFDYCLCDGQLIGSKFQGPEVTGAIAAKVTVIGTSAVPTMNNEIQAKGARVGYNKAYLVLGLITGALDLDAITSGGQLPPEEELAKAAANKDARAKADEMLCKFMEEE